MGLQTVVAEKLTPTNERDEVPMNPSTDTIVGPTTTAFTFAMKESTKRPQTVGKKQPTLKLLSHNNSKLTHPRDTKSHSLPKLPPAPGPGQTAG